MCRLRSGEPSSHQTGPRSPSARLTSSTALCAAASASRSALLLGVADRAPGRHQPADEIGSLRLVETGVRHAPQPAADDEVATVRRHRMLHDTLGRLPLRLGRRLLRRGLLRRLLAGDRHQHFLLAGCRLARLLGRLLRSLWLGSRAPPMLLRSASIRSTTFSPRGRSFAVMGLPARFWLMRSMRAVSYWSSNLSGSKWPAF